MDDLDADEWMQEVTASYLQRLGMVVQDAECPLSVLNLLKRYDICTLENVLQTGMAKPEIGSSESARNGGQ